MNFEHLPVGHPIECKKGKFGEIIATKDTQGNLDLRSSILAALASNYCPACEEDCQMRSIGNEIREKIANTLYSGLENPRPMFEHK